MLGEDRQVALRSVEAAVALAFSRGAEVVGLGGYTSIISGAGRAITGPCASMTTGCTLTGMVASDAVLRALRQRGELPGSPRHAAIIGAAGEVGSSATLSMSEHVDTLLLIGKSSQEARHPLRRLESMSRRVVRHLLQCSAHGLAFREGSLAEFVVRCAAHLTVRGGLGTDEVEVERQISSIAQSRGRIRLSCDDLSMCSTTGIVVTATSSIERIIRAHHLAPGAIVCDLGKPSNVHSEVHLGRPDALVLDGGLVRVPGGPSGVCGLPSGLVFSCVAETILIAMEARDGWPRANQEVGYHQFEWLKQAFSRHRFQLPPEGAATRLEEAVSI